MVSSPGGGQLLTIGERLRLARERAGISVGQFAERVGKHRNNVARWESRTSAVSSLKTINMYVEVCGNTTAEWLLFEIGDWPPLSPGSPDPTSADTSRYLHDLVAA